MGITTTYKCDHCGHEQPDSNQMWEIEVGIKSVHSSPTYLSSRQTALWCRKCVEDMHLLEIPHHKPERDLPPKTAFEDLVREILEDIVNG